MNTRELVNDLPEVHRNTIETYSDLIAEGTKLGHRGDVEKYGN